MSVVAKFDLLVDSLDVESPELALLVEVGRSLAWEIDTAPLVNSDEKAKPRSASAASRELRSLVAELVMKGRAGGSSDGEGPDDDWSAPADLAVVRDAKESKPRDAGSRSGGRRKAAS